jgi:hypothetical protein
MTARLSESGAQFGTSESDVLVHMRGAGAARTLLNWRDRGGKVLNTVGDPSSYWEPRISHDGTRIAEAAPLLAGRFEQKHACLSCDGKWLAFVSDKSGKSEVYVQAFPDAAGRWTVSRDAGPGAAALPEWRGDGRELVS